MATLLFFIKILSEFLVITAVFARLRVLVKINLQMMK